jgi:hypothetical protein
MDTMKEFKKRIKTDLQEANSLFRKEVCNTLKEPFYLSEIDMEEIASTIEFHADEDCKSRIMSDDGSFDAYTTEYGIHTYVWEDEDMNTNIYLEIGLTKWSGYSMNDLEPGTFEGVLKCDK